MAWVTTLPDDLKNSECERTDVTKYGGAPPVRTVQDKNALPDDDAAKTSIYTSEEVKEEFAKFSGNSVEGALLQVGIFNAIIAKMEYENDHTVAQQMLDTAELELGRVTQSGQRKRDLEQEVKEQKAEMKRLVHKAFQVFQDLLDTKMVPTWLKVVDSVCKTKGYVTWDGKRIDNRKRGMSFDSLKACIRQWLLQCCPRDSAERVRRYVSSQIKMPQRPEVHFEPWALRIQDICNYIPLLPCLKDEEGSPDDLPRANMKITTIDLCTHILAAIPFSFSSMYWASKGEHFPIDVTKLITDLKMLEPEWRQKCTLNEKVRNAGGQLKAKMKESGGMKPGDKIPKKQKSTSGNPAKKARRLCQLCVQYSPETKDTHNTGQCRKWNPDGTRKQRGESKSANHFNTEMLDCFNTMRKQNAKLLKRLDKRSKRSKKRRSYDDSSGSDSDSD